MGFRFRKSFKVGPVRATVSKSGISTSFGVKGARITKKANGNTMSTLGIPGTGISYVKETSKKSKNNNKQYTTTSITSPTSTCNAGDIYSYVEDKRYKISFWEKLGTFILSFVVCIAGMIAGFVLLAIVGAILDNNNIALFLPFVVPFGFFSMFTLTKRTPIFAKLKTGTPRLLPSLTLQEVMPFELSEKVMQAYISCLNYYNNYNLSENDTFSLNEINNKISIPITHYCIDKLFECGLILKPSRGRFLLNYDKIKEYSAKIEERNNLNARKLEAFNSALEEYNLNIQQKNDKKYLKYCSRPWFGWQFKK